MRATQRFALAYCLAISGVVPEARSQDAGTLPYRTEVQSEDWETRRTAFARLIGLEPQRYSDEGARDVGRALSQALDADEPSAETRRLALIDLLRVEDAVANEKRSDALAGKLPPEERLSEGYVNYYGDVVAAVSSLRDPRSLPALLGAITTGNLAIDTLVSFGHIAVVPVATLLDSSDSGVRAAGTLTLVRMLQRSDDVIADAADKERIGKAMTKAAVDPDPFVRIRAVQGLAVLGDTDSLALLNEIARNDPFRADYREGRPYLVRDAALQVLGSRPSE